MRRRIRFATAGVLLIVLGASGAYANRCDPYDWACDMIADWFAKDRGEEYATKFLILCLATHDCL